MKPWKIVLPIALLGLGVGIWHILTTFRPDAGSRKPPLAKPIIEVATPQLGDYQVWLSSQGTVRAHTESTLIPEVSGRIVSVSDNFREGGFFEKGDVLLRIDDRDYQTALIRAQAELAKAELALVEEEARSTQASEEWILMGIEGEANSLVLREPQLAEARATVQSAMASVEQAERNLDRTEIVAPYAGRILTKNVDIGQFVGPSTLLGRIYAVDYAEIRLPLAEWQTGFVHLPEKRRNSESAEAGHLPVVIESESFGSLAEWSGAVVRSEGAIDAASRQLFVVARVDDPYGPDHSYPLKVGMFVQAKIQGNILESVWILPTTAVRSEDQVYVVEESKIFRHPIEPVWKDRDFVVVPGDTFDSAPVLCVTPITFASDGIEVIVSGQSSVMQTGEDAPKASEGSEASS